VEANKRTNGAEATKTKGGRSVIMTAVTAKVAVNSAIKIVTKRAGSIITATTMLVENSAKRKILGERNTEDLGNMAILLLHQRE
jgi:hypothetical protein